ncbi:MAG TPA: sodium/glutamate symporter, partial [Myxococcota bacterium]|nr:sodium/glutamate symporter [Myxococcota bacterium]
VLADFGIMSTLILGSHLLRNRIKLLQNTYVPTAIIAGLLGLVLGPQFLDIIPFSLDASGTYNINTYPSFLVVLLFATLFLGKRKKKLSLKGTIEHAGDTFFFNLSSIFGQWGFTLLFGIFCLHPLFSYLPHGFSILLPAGFVGGHGTAAAIGTVLESYGLEGALSIGYASATVGILVGVLGGMILINLATRLGWTRLVQTVAEMPVSMKTGFVPEEEQQNMGKETVSPIALDPLTWHIAIVFATAIFAYRIAAFLDGLVGIRVPVFCVALLTGALLQKIMNAIKIGRYVDRHVVHRIGSMVTDFLVAFGVAAISVKVVVNYALPLIIMFTFGTAFTIFLMWFVGRRICRNFWFERSILMFGWNTGSVAMSMVLVRVVDPEMSSGVLEDFGISYFGIAFVEIAIVSLVPPLVMQGITLLPMVVLIGGFFACILLSRAMVGWFSRSPTMLRAGEAEIMGGGIAD